MKEATSVNWLKESEGQREKSAAYHDFDSLLKKAVRDFFEDSRIRDLKGERDL